MTKLELIWCF